jgi:cytochrome P450
MTDTIHAYPMRKADGCPFDPPKELGELQQQGPITKVRLWDGTTPWLVTRFAEQRELLRDPRLSADSTHPDFPRLVPIAPESTGARLSFIGMDDPEHARLRRMVTAQFAIKRVEQMGPAAQKIVDDLIDELLAGPQTVDLVEAFALPVPSRVICDLLGVPYADHGFFQENSKVLIKRSVTPEERDEARLRLLEYLDRLIDEKIKAPQDDLLSQLVERIEAGELARGEAAQMGVLMLIAGHETTANMIGLSVLVLLQHPEQLPRLRENPDAMDDAVEELLRYLTIVRSGLVRLAVEDVEIGGVLIRAGEGAVAMLSAANRDPSVFDDPDDLRLDRGSHQHMAFGFGIHQCIGQPLARAELRVALSELLSQFPNLALAGTVSDMDGRDESIVYGLHRLDVTW